MPRSTIREHGADQLLFQPSPDAQYDRVDCLLSEVTAARLPMKLLFVGNEAFQPEANHAQAH
jgi:hypothetical protein